MAEEHKQGTMQRRTACGNYAGCVTRMVPGTRHRAAKARRLRLFASGVTERANRGETNSRRTALPPGTKRAARRQYKRHLKTAQRRPGKW